MTEEDKDQGLIALVLFIIVIIISLFKQKIMENEIRVSALDGMVEIEAGDPSFGGYDGWVGYFPKDIMTDFAMSLKNIKRNKGKMFEVEYDGDEFAVLYDLQSNGVGTKNKFTAFASQHQELMVKETLEDVEFKNFLKDLVKALNSL